MKNRRDETPNDSRGGGRQVTPGPCRFRAVSKLSDGELPQAPSPPRPPPAAASVPQDWTSAPDGRLRTGRAWDGGDYVKSCRLCCHHSVPRLFLYTGRLRSAEGCSHGLGQNPHLRAARPDALLITSAHCSEFKTTRIPGDRVYLSNPSQSLRFRQLADCHQPQGKKAGCQSRKVESSHPIHCVTGRDSCKAAAQLICVQPRPHIPTPCRPELEREQGSSKNVHLHSCASSHGKPL